MAETEKKAESKKARVVAKTAMWRGGLKWEAGVNEIDAELLTKEVRKALQDDQGGNFEIL